MIASFINSHSPEGGPQKTAKQVIAKVKSLQRLEASERVSENSMAFHNFQKRHSSKGKVEAAPTENLGEMSAPPAHTMSCMPQSCCRAVCCSPVFR